MLRNRGLSYSEIEDDIYRRRVEMNAEFMFKPFYHK